MNEVINNILTRRSVRDFTDKKVSREDVELLIKTGLNAPSGKGQQTWNFIGLQNEDMITELGETIGEVLERKNYCFYGAKSLIIISNVKDGNWSKEDNAAALQNIMLAAHSMEIGSVWINQLQGICDHEQIRPILDRLGVPADHEIYGLAALGYQKSEPRGMVDKKGTFSIVD